MTGTYIRFTSQLTNGIFKALQMLLKCFNSRRMSIFYVLLSSSSSSLFGIAPIILMLYSHNAEFVIGSEFYSTVTGLLTKLKGGLLGSPQRTRCI